MKKIKKSRLILIVTSVLILVVCIGVTGYLLFSNYQNVQLFKQARDNFLRGDEKSLELAEKQLREVIRRDGDNEEAFVMLGKIAGKRKVYSEQVYYCYMAYRLNPLSAENKELYVKSLCFARYFERLENFLVQSPELAKKFDGILLYAAGRNGSISKYRTPYDKNDPFNRLAFLLFKDWKSTPAEKLTELDKISGEDSFLQQELLAARAELHLASRDLDKAEANLKQAYEVNQYAFAPALGRFYANFRNFGKALEVFEKHLEIYHDPAVAVQAAEIYCLLNRTEEIAGLRSRYQGDSGNTAMLRCYYFDALIALAKDDMASLNDLVAPLRKNINTPLAAFMFFCVDVYNNDPVAVSASYSRLLEHRQYLNLQDRADDMVSGLLKRSLNVPAEKREQLLALAEKVYKRKPEVFTAKFMLLDRRQNGTADVALLQDALKRFGKDQGIIKIAIEYYLEHDLTTAGGLIATYRKEFPAKKADMLRYEIALAAAKKDFELVSKLFRENFTPELCPAYWRFASATLREKDLQFLSRDPGYAPFCQAQLLLKKGDKIAACRLLENADARGNQHLLFFAAKTLAENGYNQAALQKYELIPDSSAYRIVKLMNMAEISAETGDFDRAADLAKHAYALAPQMPETQLCYADKLHKKGELAVIPDIIKLAAANNSLRRKMQPLWIAGMQQRIKECNIKKQREKIRELCRQLLIVAPDNDVALEYLKKLHQMPQ